MPTIPFLFSQLCLPYSDPSIHHLISFHIPFPSSNQPTQYEWPAVQEGRAFLFISRSGHLLRGALLYQLSTVYNKLPLACGFKKNAQFGGSNKHTSIVLQFWKLEEKNVLQWAEIKVSAQPGSLQKRKQLSQFLELHSLLHPLAYGFLSPGSQPKEVLSHWEWLGTQSTLFKYCNACSWTYFFSRNKKGLKITACMHSWGKYGPHIYKETKNPTATFEEPEENQGVRSKSSVLCMFPAHITICSVGRASEPCLQATLGHTPNISPSKEPAREPVVCSHSLLLQQGPQKSLAWISWPLNKFCWLRRPSTLVGNNIILSSPL